MSLSSIDRRFFMILDTSAMAVSSFQYQLTSVQLLVALSLQRPHSASHRSVVVTNVANLTFRAASWCCWLGVAFLKL